ncbi:sulfatase family protein [Brucella thiophenivorans]|uniref:Sulfatase family protein n=1 Tax=Brucella thiophenivorans TaxID=571255 RepID=A0A256FBH8_9HYPH|nr:sulfatase family protein [Brucella thiophenivorans]
MVARLLNVYSARVLFYLLMFSFTATFFLRKTVFYEMRRYWGIAIVIFCCAILMGIAARKRKAYRRRFFLLSSIPFILFIIYRWFIDAFGSFDLGAVLFHMTAGVEGGAVYEVVWLAAIYFTVAVLLLLAIHQIARHDTRLIWVDRIAFIPLLCISPLILGVVDHSWHAGDADKIIAYYSPISSNLKQVEGRRKNLLYIYAESGERTFGQLATGERVFGAMNDIAKSGVSFTRIGQAANTGWTMAGIVATQCGVPLQPNGLFAENKFETQSTFLPGAVCLADILQSVGYHTAYLNSAWLKFAGTGLFMREHGYVQIEGPDTYSVESSDYQNFWGFYDDTMLGLAFDELAKLSKNEAPYFLALSTITAHFPTGFPTASCLTELGPITGSPMLYAVECQGFEIRRFLERARLAGFLDNTIVAISSDHLSMKSDVWDELNAHQRFNYVVMLGLDQPVGTAIEKEGTMLDIYPTLLEALGFHVPNNQVGLGISLLSDQPTLAQSLGMERLNQYITYDKVLARRLWDNAESLKLAEMRDVSD